MGQMLKLGKILKVKLQITKYFNIKEANQGFEIQVEDGSSYKNPSQHENVDCYVKNKGG